MRIRKRPGVGVRMVRLLLMAAVIGGAAATARAQAQPRANACLTCHGGLAEARLSAPATLFSGEDIHRNSGFACADCHGGNPETRDAAMAHDRGRGFRGAPRASEQIAVCARCHSDPDLMRRYAPRQRVDQAAEYATSVHGKQLASGDSRVATCASCHGAHGIRVVRDAKSPVFPTNVAATCASCHANAAHMTGYKLPDGKPLPTQQLADYQKSVHYAALTTGGDLSAPTCNDCHGNHGAVPPGVGSVANVCGTCHAVFAQKFATSVHAEIFDKGCVECHSNHAVLKPSDKMLGAGEGTVCATCHSGADDKGAIAATAMRSGLDRLTDALKKSTDVIDRVGNAGIEVSAEELKLADARNHLTLARTEMHAFNPAVVEPVIQSGLTIIGDVDNAGQRAGNELSFRRRGLALSLAAILFFVAALWLKIRQIEKTER
jgi:predicted CXXCH cytochrome family protein